MRGDGRQEESVLSRWHTGGTVFWFMFYSLVVTS
jgi:hypothetical protein